MQHTSLPASVLAGSQAVPARVGLTAAQVAERRAQGDINRLPPATGRTYRAILRENVFTFINNVLFVLGAALIAVGEVSDAIVAVGVVLGNILVSVVQEIRAKRSLDRIALLTRPQVTVVRDGAEAGVDPADLVRDDIIAVRPGDQVVVDGAVVQGGPLEMDESLLTGESDRVSKAMGDPLYSGTFCVAGSGLYRAEKVGEESLANRLTASARSYRASLTPLQREINVIIRVILLVAMLYEVILLIGAPIHHVTLVEGVKRSVVIAKLVPAGLFLSVTLAYAIGALRIVRQGALVQQVNAVESLSNVDVLCLDKTGTLTANRLALEALRPVGIPEGELRRLLGMYASSTSSGNHTIDAIKAACEGTALPVAEEVPFTSDLKWSAISIDAPAAPGEYVLGAPEMVQRTVRMAPEIGEQMASWTARGLRVLIFAHAAAPAALHDGAGRPALPTGLSLRGVLAFRDELRPEARNTLARFMAAGVRPKIISGDNPATVAALASQVGLETETATVSGLDLAVMDEAQRAQAVERATIFGRITPAQKEDLVRLLRAGGHYVAMIGDGVNDVLSLKRANLAIAMESGSQAARAVSDIVLLKDSFATLPAAVEEGQRIQNGLRDVLKLFLTRVLTVAILLVAVSVLGGFPFDPKHISILTTWTVGIPSIALAAWARPGPVPRGSVTRSILHFVLPAAITMALAGVAAYLFVALTTGDPLSIRAQTALTVMAVPCGLLLLAFVQPPSRFWVGGDTLSGDWRPTILAAALFIAFVGLLAIGPLSTFFGLAPLNVDAYLLIGAIVPVWALVLRTIWRFRLLERFVGIDLP